MELVRRHRVLCYLVLAYVLAWGAALWSSFFAPGALGMHIVSPVGGPLMEEPSFRGFAQPELQRTRSRLGATAIMAVAIATG
jgi:membrane protease YdiL (CAAX protease family)